ncbi:MAG: 50S ribosomal protein L18 [Methylacidiphilales bacterium]|nr:50S ribosomal protein L18 [Candidatus Methylacidiphilales bacterium]MDW8348972.1 50S ribosomal protein L18 [Verrucomicrobiae bacterium]
MRISRRIVRKRIHKRIRKKISGTAKRPRLSVAFSGKHIYTQIINDEAGVTLASAATTEKELRAKKLSANVNSARVIGTLIAQRAKEKNIHQVVFDRGGFIYHGKVKALADAAREAGLEF